MMLKPLQVTLVVTCISAATCLSPRFRARRQAENGDNPLLQDTFLGNDVSQFTLHSHDQDPSQSVDQLQDNFQGDNFAKFKDGDLEDQLLLFLEEQNNLGSRQRPNEDDFSLNGVGSFEETFARGQDAEEDAGLVTLADHLDKEHFSPDTFRPSVRKE